MGVYQKLQLKAVPGPSDLATYQGTLGAVVMAEAAEKKWTLPGDMPKVLDAFHRALVQFKWRWTPSRGCGDQGAAARTLDGDIVHAECFVPANALRQLLIAPDPWGFGVDEGSATVKTYAGEPSIIGGDPPGGPTLGKGFRRAINPSMGFVSPHPREGIHHLAPNVYDVIARQVAPMYAWSDHKVVLYAGKYWDPCYNNIYTVLQQMAVALRIGVNEDARPTKTIQEAMARIEETKLMVMNWHQVVYFRSIAPTEVRPGDVRVEGPFGDSLYGDEASDGPPTPLDRWGGAE